MNRGGYLLDSGSLYSLWFRFRLGSGVKNMIQGYWFDRDGLLHETEEELAAAFGPSAVESEGELVQVVVEMLVADRPLVRPYQPPLDERDHSVDSRH
jgi:hypothetical protein